MRSEGRAPHPILYYVLFSARFGDEPGFVVGGGEDTHRSGTLRVPIRSYDDGIVWAYAICFPHHRNVS